MLVPVQVRLGVNSETGDIDRNAPLLVWGEGAEPHPSVYEDLPDAMAQIAQGEAQARFMGEWDGERWRIGNRIVE